MKRSLLALVFLLVTVREAPSSDGWGVLVLAHGGEPRWNDAVRKAVAKAKLGHPTEIAFGMAAMPGEVQGIAEALGRLRRAGATRIVAVPLLVSSYSEVYRQYQFILGLSREPGFTELEMKLMHSMHSAGHHAMDMGPVSPVRVDGTPIVLTRALDDSPEVAEVLIHRARKLSRDPARETAVLVAHGPVGDEDNERWKETLAKLQERLLAGVPFARVVPHSLRDDAPPAVRESATRALREAVNGAKEEGRSALILPVLVSTGGIERGVVRRLEGLPYRMGKPLLPHPAISRWIARKVAETIDKAAVPRQP